MACRLAEAQACPGCSPDEQSTQIKLEGQPSGYINSTNPPCPPPVRCQIAQIASTISARGEIAETNYESLSASLIAEAGTQVQTLGSQGLGTASCRNVFTVLPPGSVVTRVVLAAQDVNGRTRCDSECVDERLSCFRV
jgi:hypothetical protein